MFNDVYFEDNGTQVYLGLSEHGCVVHAAHDVILRARKNCQGDQAIINANLLARGHDLQRHTTMSTLSLHLKAGGKKCEHHGRKS